MRAVSVKRAAQMRLYRPLAAAFLEAHPQCQFPLECHDRAVDLHHKRGRSGLRLLDETYWAASCRFHNDYAETETGHALELGWLLPIESTA